MPYDYQVRIQRRVRRAILAAAAIAGLFLLLALPERMLGWSGLGIGTAAVPDTPAVTETTVEEPVAALRTPPGLDHLTFPGYAEWTEATEGSCVDCEWNWSYGVESLVDVVDTEALVQLERSSTPTQSGADASHGASSLRGPGGAGGAVGGGALTGGAGSMGAPAKPEDGTGQQAANEVSDATTTETSELAAESDPVPPPSLLSAAGSQAQSDSAGRPDDAWTLLEAGVIDPQSSAGANLFETRVGPDQRNAPPPAVPGPPSTPEPPTNDPPTTPEPPTVAAESSIAPDAPAVRDTPATPDAPGVPGSPTALDTPAGPDTPVALDTPVAPAVPEPTQLILMGLALSAVVYRMRRVADR